MSALALIAVLLAAPPQPPALVMPGDDASKRFTDAFELGESLYGQGEYGAAIFHFRRADAARVTPEVAYDLAKCFERLGDTAFTAYYYRLYLKRAPKAADALEVAERLETLMAKERERGQVFVEADAWAATGLSLAGRRFPESPVASFLPPGEYELSGLFPSGVFTTPLTLKKGQVTTAFFDPVRAPLVSAGPDLFSKAPKAVPLPGTRIASFAAGGVGVAALLVGGIVGASSADDARAAANHSLPVSDAYGLALSANDKATGANVMFAVASAALVTGVVLFVVSLVPAPGATP